MKRPNKIERMNAYLYAWAILTGRIEDICEYNLNFLCYILSDYHEETEGSSILASDVVKLYPEISKQKPKKSGAFWWPTHDKQSRITALENAIKLLA